MADVLLDIRRLTVVMKTGGPPLVNGVNLAIEKGAVCALVGDSGSGKSLIACAVVGVLAENLHSEGEILFGGQNLLAMTEQRLGRVRGRRVGVVMQNCAGSLDPLLANGRHLAMVVKAHRRPGENVRERCLALLRQVELDEPEQVMTQYPHQLSGGMKQRLQTAIGLAGRPELLILDEPTKGLDLVLRRQTADMIDAIRQQTGVTILLITHDMELAHQLSESCYVIRSGRITTHGPTRALFGAAADPVLAGLLYAERRMNGFFPETNTLEVAPCWR